MSKVNYKFYEDKLIRELQEYVDKTYDQHYATDKYQATDVIIDSGHGTGFCMGNIVKYAKRYKQKGNSDEWRKDVMKILHYALIQLFIHDEENPTPANFDLPNPAISDDVDWNHAPTRGTLTVNGRSIDDAKPHEWDALRNNGWPSIE